MSKGKWVKNRDKKEDTKTVCSSPHSGIVFVPLGWVGKKVHVRLVD